MSCGMPVPPVNGSIAGQDFSLGARVTYQCNPGFRLSGPITTSVICQESGRWSPIEAPPRCIREYSSGLQSQVEKTPNHYKKPTTNKKKRINLNELWFDLWSSSCHLPRHWSLCSGTWEMEANLWDSKPIWCYHDAHLRPRILLQRSKGNSLPSQQHMELSKSSPSLREWV